jgi:glutamyl/glutaminyl-tRNA synthetase
MNRRGWRIIFPMTVNKDTLHTFSFRKTRLAPTPSGFLHLGNIMSFALTATLAQKAGASILLRIDDLDMMRVQPAYVQDIFDTLQYLHIPWHEGPRNMVEYEKEFSQVYRMHMYRQALEQLVVSGAVFACTCSRKQTFAHHPDGAYPGTCRYRSLSIQDSNSSWRLHTDQETVLTVKHVNGTMINSGLPASMHDFVVKKKDGFPAYQLTSLLDDVYYGVDCIVRGEDLWPSTLAQHYLSMQLGQNDFSQTLFCHHPLLMEPGGQKLSKSAGATSVQYLRNQGKSPADIYALAAQLAGITTPVTDWRELGEAVIEAHSS